MLFVLGDAFVCVRVCMNLVDGHCLLLEAIHACICVYI